jgi:hypothetical protein
MKGDNPETHTFTRDYAATLFTAGQKTVLATPLPEFKPESFLFLSKA